MIIRLRSRDGLERVEVRDSATVAELKSAIHAKLSIPLDDMLLSKDPALLNAKNDTIVIDAFDDMSDSSTSLASLGLGHGSLVHLLYHYERQVEGAKLSEFDKRPFGAHMTVESMVAAQTRIERQESPACASVSFDMHAANAFQSYVQSALAFSIKRGGILYGEFLEDNSVCVHAIYEPPQEGGADHLVLERNTEDEQHADFIAEVLGWTKVGWIYTQSTKEREFICSGEEICQMAAMQDEMGERAVTAVAALFPPDEEGAAPEVHFEAFQVSAQCVKLWKEGWFQVDIGAEPAGAIPVRNPKDPENKTPVIVARHDVAKIDADYFLVPVGIKDHEGPLRNAFPVENRLILQGSSDLKAALQRMAAHHYAERLADFHLLLFLARQPSFGDADVKAVVDAVKRRDKIVLPEGYQVMINALAGV